MLAVVIENRDASVGHEHWHCDLLHVTLAAIEAFQLRHRDLLIHELGQIVHVLAIDLVLHRRQTGDSGFGHGKRQAIVICLSTDEVEAVLRASRLPVSHLFPSIDESLREGD